MFYKSLLKAFEAGELAVTIEETENSIVITSLKGSALIKLKAIFLSEKERYCLAQTAKYFTKPCDTEEAMQIALKDLIADCDKLLERTQPYLKARTR